MAVCEGELAAPVSIDIPASSAEMVRLEGVSFAYNSCYVLENVNLVVTAGEFLALIGANGSAKTTLMKIMVGLLKPRAGRVELLGQDIRSFRAWHRIGYISQNAGHINTSFPATVAEVVASGYYHGWRGMFAARARQRAVQGALELVGIPDLAGRLVGELSGGQRQKVFLARALVSRPSALFLDEPTTGIDPSAREEFYRLLEQLNRQEGLTIIIITHDFQAALARAQKIGCVRDRNVYIHTNLSEVDQDHLAEVLGYQIGASHVRL
ncbi:MAG: zinc transport system ATP-binding protein [Moorella sp. (in: firmicutes)]|uniref:High-affinity zinc uptake system ATP-binding protein ZnuC n=1 Tax=Neomoorella thermoacetica TaxID=1525 RepID=A0A1J5NJ66_NEOTH|nr:zinc transport system ATP-binding protein [Moorella sp. (in: firmicutes)]OIQ53507.1 high-affinity zinc uptake system ATP-binding protein ZnuC [Moorella thermoacetica]